MVHAVAVAAQNKQRESQSIYGATRTTARWIRRCRRTPTWLWPCRPAPCPVRREDECV